MYPTERRILSKKREADPEQDSKLPEAQQMGNAHDNSILRNTAAFPSPESPETSNDGVRRATISGVPMQTANRIVTGRIACQTCQQRKRKCSGQNNRQPIQHTLQCDYCAENGLQCVWKAPRRTIAKAHSRQRPNTAGSSSSAVGQGDRSQLQTKSACVACQKRKQRCTGDRPACATCASKGYTCTYDVADGKTRSEDLKSKIQEATDRVERLTRLLSAMRHGSDQQSTSLLARLRMGDSLEELLSTEMDLTNLAAFSGAFHQQATEASRHSETHPKQLHVLPQNIQMEEPLALKPSQAFSESSVTSEIPLSATSSFSYEFPTIYPRLSAEDIEQANNPYKQAFSS